MTVVNNCKHVWYGAPVYHTINIEGASLLYRLNLCDECATTQLIAMREKQAT